MNVSYLSNKPTFNCSVSSADWRTYQNLKPSILVAEDHEDTRYLLKTVLELWHCRVIEAENGKSAVEMATQEKPDAILMDIVLPLLDGLQATQQIRQLEKIRHTPIIFITGYIADGIRIVADAVGGDDFIEKPFDFEELKSSLLRFCPKLRTRNLAVIGG